MSGNLSLVRDLAGGSDIKVKKLPMYNLRHLQSGWVKPRRRANIYCYRPWPTLRQLYYSLVEGRSCSTSTTVFEWFLPYIDCSRRVAALAKPQGWKSLAISLEICSHIWNSCYFRNYNNWANPHWKKKILENSLLQFLRIYSDLSEFINHKEKIKHKFFFFFPASLHYLPLFNMFCSLIFT